MTMIWASNNFFFYYKRIDLNDQNCWNGRWTWIFFLSFLYTHRTMYNHQSYNYFRLIHHFRLILRRLNSTLIFYHKSHIVLLLLLRDDIIMHIKLNMNMVSFDFITKKKINKILLKLYTQLWFFHFDFQ